MNVVLYNCGQNLNRAYRTCFCFGIKTLYLVNTNNHFIEWELKGNLFSAKDKVAVIKSDALPRLGDNVVAFENYYKQPLFDFDWNGIDTILIGGESMGLPKLKIKNKVTIPTINSLCLTIEASLAIILYDYKQKELL